MDDIWADTTGEKYLYRHRRSTVEALDELQRSYLYLCPHERLNDLNDCRLFLEPIPSDLTKEKKLECLTAFFRLNGVGSKEHEVIPNDLTKEMNLEYLIALLKRNGRGSKEREAIQNSEKYEDWPHVNNIFDQLTANYREIFENQFKSTQFGVCCFSEKSLNPTMMAHYGDNKGVVFCFDAKKLRRELPEDNVLFKAEYVKTPGQLNILNLFHEKVTDDKVKDLIDMVIRQKYVDWSYEEEVRLISYIYSDLEVSISKGLIVGVCLGIDASPAAIRVFYRACRELNIPCFKAMPGNHFDYIPKRINESDFDVDK
jgi:hypothetical protein